MSARTCLCWGHLGRGDTASDRQSGPPGIPWPLLDPPSPHGPASATTITHCTNQSQACSSIHKQNLKAFDQYFIFSKYDMIPVHAWVIHILNCLNAFVNYKFTPSIGNWPSRELCGFPHLWHALDGESCCLMPRLFSVSPLSQTCRAQTWPPAMIKNMQNLL